MTVYGPDIYNGQAGLDLTRLADASFIIAKTTEGTYYVDQSYQSWRRQAQASGELFVWYHFLTRENAQAQVDNTRQNVGDPSLPGMLDVETAYGWTPTLQQVVDYVDAAKAAGLDVRLVYLPRWVWVQMGSPDLVPLRERGLDLVSSSYPGGAGTASQIYPGDGAAGWEGYGGVSPLIYQFTDQALDGGMRMDYNAYRGTVQQLRNKLGGQVILGQDDIQAVAQAAALAVNSFRDNNNKVEMPDGSLYAASAYELAAGSWRAVNQADGGLEQTRAQVNQIYHLTYPTADQIGEAVAAHLAGGGGATPASIAEAVGHLFAEKLSAATAPTSAATS